MRLRIPQVIAIVLVLFTAVPILFAGGKQDPALSQADSLIKSKYYDEAIRVLIEYVKANPDRFDEAQRRLQRIVGIRTQYNGIAGELLEVVATEPENSEKILFISRQLESLESPQNTGARDFLERTRDLALFAHNRERLGQILANGQALMDQGDHAGAFAAYAGGLDIYRDEFFTAPYDEELVSQVRKTIEVLSAEIAAFPSLLGPLSNGLASMEQLGRQEVPPPAQVRGLYQQIGPLLDRFSDLRNTLVETGGFYDNQLALLQQADPTLGDRSFLSFASRLLHGRGREQAHESMSGVMEEFWKALMSRMEAAAWGMAQRAFITALEALAKGDYQESRSYLVQVTPYATVPADMAARWSQFYQSEGAEFAVLFGKQIAVEKTDDYLNYEALTQLAANLEELVRIGLQYQELLRGDFSSLDAWRFGARSVSAVEEQEGKIRSSFNALAGRIDILNALVNREISEFRTQTIHYEESTSQAYFNEASALINSLGAKITGELIQSAVRLYTVANGELEMRLGARETELGRGAGQLRGTSQTNGEGGTYLAYFPAEALEGLNRMARELEQDVSAAEALLSRYAEESSILLADGELRRLWSSAQALADRFSSIGEQGRSLSAQAQIRIAQAETSRFEGEQFYQNARRALNQSDFDLARDQLLQATSRYQASLEIQESSSLRKEWDTRAVDLGAVIKRTENESIVREVRALVNDGREAYFAGDFEHAEELLVRARNRWQLNNLEDDPELSYWLTVVRGALSLRSGRTIPATAPLYAEMSQLLSDARQKYDEGVQKFNESAREEGLVIFAQARQRTREVKLMFPINQEAGILELRMDLVADPAAFNASFARRFNDAVAGTKPNLRSLEAFADLQNLAEINPRYPGMRNAVLQAEIDMGYRLPPPNPQALARSQELTQQARSIINASTRSQFPIALELLIQAIQLNPENSQATYEKDRVQILLGNEGSVVLNSAAEQEYQRAVQELQQRNTLAALSIVQQLLQNPKNRNSPRLLELQRRIESSL